jgi:hypothetical protein
VIFATRVVKILKRAEHAVNQAVFVRAFVSISAHHLPGKACLEHAIESLWRIRVGMESLAAKNS